MQIKRTIVTVVCATCLVAINLYEAYEFSQQLLMYLSAEGDACLALQPGVQDLASFLLERGARRTC